MLSEERFDLADEVRLVPGCEVGVESRDLGGNPQLGEAGDLTIEEPVRLDIRVGVPAPHPQSLAQDRSREAARGQTELEPQYVGLDFPGQVVDAQAERALAGFCAEAFEAGSEVGVSFGRVPFQRLDRPM